jgi:hypothetical protein
MVRLRDDAGAVRCQPYRIGQRRIAVRHAVVGQDAPPRGGCIPVNVLQPYLAVLPIALWVW